MFACRRARGLLAAALYETLDQSEQGFLDQHLARCPACRTEKSSLTDLVNAVSRESAPEQIDLLPALRRRIAEPERSSAALTPRFALAGALCVILVAFWWLLPLTKDAAPPVVAKVTPAETNSQVAAALREANALMAAHNPKEAFLTLKKAADASPNAPETPEAMLKLADISFDELHWYKDSYAIHKLLLSKYLQSTKASPEADKIQERLNELAEASGHDFEPLFQLDEARADRSGSFTKLEALVAEHPAGYIAHDAVMTMAKVVAEENPGAASVTMAALLEKIRGRCTKPVAVAQLKWELARVYDHDNQDSSKAMDLYAEVAKGPNNDLARMAKAAMAELEGSSPAPK